MTNCNEYFYKGKHLRVVSHINHSKVIASVLEDFNTDSFNQHDVGTELLVHVNELDKVCSNVFSLKDKVRTTLKTGTLTGVVTGFEYCTNRVIVTSDKIGAYRDDRTRYAYKLSELEHNYYPRPVLFEKGYYYKINNKETVYAVSQSGDPELIMLVTKEGDIFAANMGTIHDAIGLEMSHGIKTVQKKKGW